MLRSSGTLGLIYSFFLLALSPAFVTGKSLDEQSALNAVAEEKEVIHSDADLQRLVQQLGSDSFSERRQAFSQLWRMGSSVVQRLEEAARLENREVAESARRLKILAKIRDHCDDFQSALSLMELIATPHESNLLRLAQQGRWEMIPFYLDEHPAIAIRAQESFLQQDSSLVLIHHLVDLAQKQKRVPDAWPVISRLVPLELAFWTSHHLDLPLPVSAQDDHERAVQLFLLGEVDQALQLKISPQLKLRLATRGFQWHLLKVPSVQQALLEGQHSTSQQAALAVLHEFAGDRQAAAQRWSELRNQSDQTDQTDQLDPSNFAILEALRSAASDSPDPSSYHQLLFSLLISGQTAVVEKFLEEQSPGLAFDLYIASNDYTSAFRQVGLEPELTNFGAWLDRLSSEANSSLPDDLRSSEDETGDLTAAITLGKIGSIAIGLGYRTEAKQILERLVQLGKRSYRRQNPIWDRCILRWMGRDEWRSCCLDVVAEQFDSLPKTHRQVIFAKLFPELGDYAWKLFQEAPILTADESAAEENYDIQKRRLALEQLDHLERFDREYFGDDHQQTIKEWLYRAIEREDDEENAASEDGSALLPLIEVVHSMGYTNLAMELLQLGIVQSLDTFRLYHLAAKVSLESQNAEAAMDYLDAASPSMIDHHRDVTVRVQARLALGQFEEAEQNNLAHWLRMAGVSWNGDRSAGYRVTEDLISDHRWEQALPYAQRNFQLDRFVSYYFGFWEARQYSRILQELKEFEHSADVMRAVFVELLRPFSQTLRVFVENEELSLLRYTAVRERISRAMAMIQKSDFESANHELDVAYRLHPLDIEAVVHCFPLLVEAGQTELAEELYRKYDSTILAHLQRWPNDAMNLNNLAWMYSQCDRQLEEALEFSKRSVQLAPSSSVYLDTLAEIHFRLGNTEKATELMRRCVSLDPREPHFRENLERFSKR